MRRFLKLFFVVLVLGLVLIPTWTALAAISLAPMVSYGGLGTNPNTLTTADFNGDTYADLAIANVSSANISILLGNGDGTFGAATNLPVGVSPIGMITGLFNADPFLDLAVANNLGNTISILLGNGDGTFGAATTIAAGNSPYILVAADFNGDSQLDLAVASSGLDSVNVFLGNGDGTFGAFTSFPAGNGAAGLAVGDFNGDNRLDLATSNVISDDISVLLGNGDGTFNAPTNLAAGDSPQAIITADFDGDSDLDLAVVARLDNTLNLFLGNGDGTFAAFTSWAVGTGAIYVSTGDLDGDSDRDMAVGSSASNTITVLENSGSGTFTATNLPAGDNPSGVLIQDFGGNSRPDIVVVHFNTNSFGVFINTLNIAPVLNASGNPALPAIHEDEFTNAGMLVSDLINSVLPLDIISDSDPAALEGIAVIGVDNTNGTWEFSTNGGSSWTPVGSPSIAAARLLASDANSRIRFVPTAGFDGNLPNGLLFRAWDQTMGANGAVGDTTTNAGATAFSSAFETVSITVNPSVVVVAPTPTPTPVADVAVASSIDATFISKTVDKTLAQPGDTLTYTITFTNPKGNMLNNVVISDTFDSRLSNVRVVSTSLGTASVSGNTVTVQGFNLLPGQQATLIITAQISSRAQPGDVIRNTATLESPDASIHVSNAAETIILPGSLPATGERDRANYLLWLLPLFAALLLGFYITKMRRWNV